jgi:hypothetical protein
MVIYLYRRLILSKLLYCERLPNLPWYYLRHERNFNIVPLLCTGILHILNDLFMCLLRFNLSTHLL